MSEKSESKNERLVKRHKKAKNVEYTVCIPSTVIGKANAKLLGQITQVAFELAKSLTIYNVSEVVILDVPEDQRPTVIAEGNKIKFGEETAAQKSKSKVNEECLILATLLQYFITPPYLVGSLIKGEPLRYLKYVGKYPTITTLPFMVTNFLDGNENAGTYREGLSVPEKKEGPKKAPGSKVKRKKDRLAMTKYVNVGLEKPLELAKEKIPANVRVTVDVKERKIVSPYEAYYADKVGARTSVGFHVRVAKLFSSVFTECAFPSGYTSSIFVESGNYFAGKKSELFESSGIAKLDHLELGKKDNNIIVFVGRKQDVQASFNADPALKEAGNLAEFFNNRLEVPVMTRIEDAVLISLSKLDSMV